MFGKKKEVWKDAVGYEGHYMVSDQGRVKSVKFSKEKVMRPWINTAGYPLVNLSLDGRQRTTCVHRMVCKAFNGAIPEGFDVHHIDGNKTNNNLSNLKVINHGKHVRQHGQGAGNNLAKLTEADALEIRKLHKQGMKQSDIAKHFGIARQNVSCIVLRKTWTHI